MSVRQFYLFKSCSSLEFAKPQRLVQHGNLEPKHRTPACQQGSRAGLMGRVTQAAPAIMDARNTNGCLRSLLYAGKARGNPGRGECRPGRTTGDGARCWPHTGGWSCVHVLGNRPSDVAQCFGKCTFQVVAVCEGREDRVARARSRPPPVGTLPAPNGCLTETNDRGSFRNNFLLI